MSTKSPKTIYLSAHACSDDGDGPTCAKVILDADLVADVRRLRGLVEAHQLSEARVWAGPDAWGPEGIDDEMRFDGGELVVSAKGFTFADQPKHCDYKVETYFVDFKVFDQWLLADEQVVYHSSGKEEDLRDLVEEHFSEPPSPNQP